MDKLNVKFRNSFYDEDAPHGEVVELVKCLPALICRIHQIQYQLGLNFEYE